jgi:hypothetical protein
MAGMTAGWEGGEGLIFDGPKTQPAAFLGPKRKGLSSGKPRPKKSIGRNDAAYRHKFDLGLQSADSH